MVTKGPTGSREDAFNLGIYRMQVLGRDRTLMRWLKHRGGAQHHRRWGQTRREPLPAAAVIGADPGVILAAVTPVPDTMSEYQFAGLLRRDAESLATSFRKHGLTQSGEATLRDVQRRALGPGPEPRVELP